MTSVAITILMEATAVIGISTDVCSFHSIDIPGHVCNEYSIFSLDQSHFQSLYLRFSIDVVLVIFSFPREIAS